MRLWVSALMFFTFMGLMTISACKSSIEPPTPAKGEPHWRPTEERHGPPEGKPEAQEDATDLPPSTNKIEGSDGNDELQGTAESDIIEGDAGDDQLAGDDGNDELSGGPGHDVLNGGEGDDKLNGGPGSDVLNGGPGNDTLRGGEGDDKMHGNEGNDFLYAGEGRDSLEGGPGEDTLEAGDGDDVIVGGTDKDSMLGNEGADTFLYRAGHGDGSVDRIGDFNPQEGDKLDLSEMMARDKYAGNGSMDSLAPWLRMSDTLLEYDASGTGESFKPLVDLGRAISLSELSDGGHLIVIFAK